jgi:hypothetical protein
MLTDPLQILIIDAALTAICRQPESAGDARLVLAGADVDDDRLLTVLGDRPKITGDNWGRTQFLGIYMYARDSQHAAQRRRPYRVNRSIDEGQGVGTAARP